MSIFFLIASVNSNAQNVLMNGDFEEGDFTGFAVSGNGYTQIIPPFVGISNPGDFAFVNNPQTLNTNFISGGDHTTGNGIMLAFDGNTTGGQQRFWQAGDGGTGLCCLKLGSTYRFSYWIKSISTAVTSNATRADIGIEINNANNITLTSGNAQAPLPADGWQQVTYSFVATSNCVNIELWNNNTNSIGNDFAIDDMMLVSLDDPLAATYSVIDINCPQDNTGFIGIYPRGGIPPFNFTITKPGFVEANTTGIFEQLPPGLYQVEVTDSVGDKISFVVEVLIVEPELLVSENQSICFGETTTVQAFTDFDITWISNPEDNSIVELPDNALQVSPQETTTYNAEIEYIVDIEVIYNGDFEEGNEGFITDYNYLEINSAGLQGSYGVVSDASTWFDLFESCTAQAGTNFLIADGATENNCKDKLWCQSVFIIPGQEYEFIYWVQTLNENDENPANIVVEINGVAIGEDSAPTVGCGWEERSYIWNSTGTVAEICIYNTVKEANGNDFGLDNIQFLTEQICIENRTVVVEIENCFCPEIVNPQGFQTVCQGEALSPLSADIVLEGFQGQINFVYFNTPQVEDDMYTGGTLLGQVNSTTSVTYNFPPLGTPNSLPNVPGTYYVYAILANLPPNPACRPYIEVPITIEELFTPTFDVEQVVCEIDNYMLPTISDNGFEGVWSPSNLVLESGTYTFTPVSEDCIETVELDMTVILNEVPEFDLPTDICLDGFVDLPLVSDNGFVGTWSPPFDPSQDTTYTFTPNEFECSNQTFNITIVSQEIVYNEDEITPLEVCDQNNNGFSSEFDLTSRVAEITFANPDLEVSFHLTENDALTGINPVQTPYSNVNPYQQTLYARILKTDNGCFKITSLDLIVYDSPLLEDVGPLVKCDTFEVGINFFDLTEVEDALFVEGQNTSNFEISYHVSESAANNNINPIEFPANYLMEINPQTIFIRVNDPSSPNNCRNIKPLQLIVNPLPLITAPTFLADCESDDPENQTTFETSIFNLSDKIPEITNNNTTLNVFFYESLEDQQNETPIEDIFNYENQANPQSLYISVISQDTGCIAFTTLTLAVEPTPSIPEPEPIIVCDADNDGTSEVDLFAAIDNILNGEENALISFHLTEIDALNNDNPIAIEDDEGNSILFQVFNPFGQTLYVRVEFDANSGSNINDCFVIRALPLEVRESPLIQELQDLSICDDETLNGFAAFDLVQNTANAIGTQDDETLQVTYHVVQADAELGLNPISIPSNYTNITNPQTIYVRIEDTETTCFDLFGFEGDNSFTLTVEPYPDLIPVNIPLRVCNTQANPDAEFPTGTFNLTDKEEEITGLSPIPAHIEIRYYETEEDLINQVNEIENPTAYINTTIPPMSIFIEAINTSTENQCNNYMPFTIDVLPYPFPVELSDEERRLTACDDNNDGIAPAPFNLMQIGQQITGSENNLGTYYLTEEAAIAQDQSQLILNPEAYVNNPELNELDENFFPTNTQVVWLRLDSNAEGNFCFFTISIEIVVEPSPELNPLGNPFGYTLCKGEPTQLPSAEEVVFSLYNATDGSPNQIIPILDPSIAQNQSDYEYSLHLSEFDAQEGINPLAPNYQVSNGESIYLRVTHLITGCYNINNIAEIIVSIEPRPDINDTTLLPMVVCADEQFDSTGQAENQAVATIDLTLRDAEIDPNFNDEDNNTLVEYFANEEDFNNGVAIADPSNFLTTETPIVIFAHVVDLDNFCTSFTAQSFEIQVNPLPLVDITDWDGAIICINPQTGEVINNAFSPPVLDTGLSEEFYNFEWTLNDAPLDANESSYAPTQAGTYTVTVTDFTNNLTSCQATSTATIIESNPPQFEVNVLSQAFDRTHSLEVFNIQGTGEYEFSIDNGPWQNLTSGQESIIFSGLDAGERIVRGRDSGGCGQFTIGVSLIDYPRFFTPNEDGYNDTWNIIGLANQPNAKIYIFDRYGKLLKQLNPASQGWDGTYNGKAMIGNDYWFRVEYDDPSSGARKEFKANFTLKR